MWVHVALVGPSTAFRGMVIDPVFKLRAGRALPRPPSWSHLDGSLQAIAELVPPWWKLPALSAEKSLFLWFFAMLIVPLVLLWVAVRLWRREHTARAAIVALRCVCSASVSCPQALQRPDSTHLSWVTCISFPLLILAVDRARRTTDGRARTVRQRVAAGVAVAVGLTLVVAPLFTFRYYLLHARVSCRQRADAISRVAQRSPLLPRRLRAVPGQPRRDRRSRPAVETGRSACWSGRATCGAPGTAMRSSTTCSPS